ncbi:hypothetical protein BKA64DRAFT_759013 [Cadophora sp. MPI-SDFR-AT-0126]|nr:hypothetical protein BKA64DRAFT_759013 [Leotiomycetes sp. MPI-SDFR-AT-0126]
MTDKTSRKFANTSPSSTPVSPDELGTYGTIQPSGASKSNETGSPKELVDEGVSGISTPLATPALGTTVWKDESNATGAGMESSAKEDTNLAKVTSENTYANREETEPSHPRLLSHLPPAMVRSAVLSPPGPQTNRDLPRIKLPSLQPSPHIFGGLSPTGRRQAPTDSSLPESESIPEDEIKARFDLLRSAEKMSERRKATEPSRDAGHKTEEGGIWKYDGALHPTPFGNKLAVLELEVDDTTHAYIIDISASKEFARQLNEAIETYDKRKATEKLKEDSENGASEEVMAEERHNMFQRTLSSVCGDVANREECRTSHLAADRFRGRPRSSGTDSLSSRM